MSDDHRESIALKIISRFKKCAAPSAAHSSVPRCGVSVPFAAICHSCHSYKASVISTPNCSRSSDRNVPIIAGTMSTSPPERPTRPAPVLGVAPLRNWLASIGPAAIALLMIILRWTCRVRMHNDQRQALTGAGTPYVYSVLHAQQLAAATCGHRGTAAMVSQSQDGALRSTRLEMRRHHPDPRLQPAPGPRPRRTGCALQSH